MELNMDLVRALQRELTDDQLDLLANALEDHHDDLRHNADNVVGQLYDGDAEIVNTSANLLTTLRRARRSM